VEMEDRILEAFNSANADQIARGTVWYSEYRSLAITNGNNLSIEQIAGLVGVSSINTNPAQGMRWISKFARGIAGGHLPIVCERGTQIIAATNSTFDAIREIACPSTSPARKVRNFACNTYTGGATCKHEIPCVTVDRWANRVATGDAKAGVPSGKNYDAIANAYRNVAITLNLPVAIVQAITWVVVAEPNGPKN
jgi:hypothetical protein